MKNNEYQFNIVSLSIVMYQWTNKSKINFYKEARIKNVNDN